MNEKRSNPKKSYYRNSARIPQGAAPVRSNQMSADERIVSRANARKRRNRRKKLIFRGIIGGFFLIAAIVLVLIMFFNINSITVSGDDVYSDTDIIEASDAKTGDNLIFVSAKKINEKITENLPYVKSVKIKRHLPATLEIVITKTVAEYAVMIDTQYSLLDGDGKVLEKGLDFVGENIIVANLGKVSSAETGKTVELEDEKIFDKLMKLKSAFSETGLTGITSADLTNIYDIRLVYEGRITLILGETDSDSLVHKLALAKEAIKTQNEENNTYRGTINLTVSGKAYWAEETVTELTEPSTDEDSSDENDSAVSEDNPEGITENNTENESENTTSTAA